MKLYSTIWIDAEPAEVWNVLKDPNLMELWNPKCMGSPAGDGPFGVGYTYKASFQMGRNPERKCDCRIECYEKNRRLATVYSGDMAFIKSGGYVTETYELVEKKNGTLIKQTVDLKYSGIPLWARLLMGFINRVGSKAGAGPLDGIKELVEGVKSN